MCNFSPGVVVLLRMYTKTNRLPAGPQKLDSHWLFCSLCELQLGWRANISSILTTAPVSCYMLIANNTRHLSVQKVEANHTNQHYYHQALSCPIQTFTLTYKKRTIPTGTLIVILPLVHPIANVAYPEVSTWYIRFTLTAPSTRCCSCVITTITACKNRHPRRHYDAATVETSGCELLGCSLRFEEN